MIAALYVERDGCYWGLEGVDPWDEERDAREYRGPHPVLAHPPCARWGCYWGGGPSARVKRLKGDDGQCFAHALWAVRTFGGVLEHPEASSAWAWHGIAAPPRAGQWVRADQWGWTCCVEQGHYGHRARKATWLYAVGVSRLPQLLWGPSQGERMDEGYHTSDERQAARARGALPRQRLSRGQRLATPIPFRDTLLALARRVG